MDGSKSNVRCRSVQCSAGTGPWKFVDKTLRSDDTVEQMRLAKNVDWWGTQGDITELVVKSYTTADNVKQALLKEQLDIAVGAGVLTPAQVKEFEQNHASDFQV